MRVIAVTFRENLRKTDIVARLGGDEFALLLPETDHSAADIVVAKLNEHLVKAMAQNGWPITFSIGVITFLNTPGSPEEAIRMADDLMYKAKNGGKNSIRYAVWIESALLN